MTPDELKAALLDEWLKLDALKSTITSPAGTYHNSATGKFTGRPGGKAGGDLNRMDQKSPAEMADLGERMKKLWVADSPADALNWAGQMGLKVRSSPGKIAPDVLKEQMANPKSGRDYFYAWNKKNQHVGTFERVNKTTTFEWRPRNVSPPPLIKAVITSPAGTYHDTATGKFASKPGGVVAGGKKGGINREFVAIFKEYDGLFDSPVIERVRKMTAQVRKKTRKVLDLMMGPDMTMDKALNRVLSEK